MPPHLQEFLFKLEEWLAALAPYALFVAAAALAGVAAWAVYKLQVVDIHEQMGTQLNVPALLGASALFAWPLFAFTQHLFYLFFPSLLGFIISAVRPFRREVRLSSGVVLEEFDALPRRRSAWVDEASKVFAVHRFAIIGAFLLVLMTAAFASVAGRAGWDVPSVAPSWLDVLLAAVGAAYSAWVLAKWRRVIEHRFHKAAREK